LAARLDRCPRGRRGLQLYGWIRAREASERTDRNDDVSGEFYAIGVLIVEGTKADRPGINGK
jgi:hypothetical protein